MTSDSVTYNSHKGKFPVIRLDTANVVRCGGVEGGHQSTQGGTELGPHRHLGNRPHSILPATTVT